MIVDQQLQSQLLARPQQQDLVPPPRFTGKTFESYQRDPSIHGQDFALQAIIDFATAGPVKWWQLSRRTEKRGLYLDGDFGVGKTHLLAAMYHASTGSKTYLSFAEAISLCIVLGPEPASDSIAADLVCIDEFELDDPSNTRLADLLVYNLTQRGCRIAVTSNTVPGELGQGRMAVDKFRNQLVRIADTFADVHVPGYDYRQKNRTTTDDNPAYWNSTVIDFSQQGDGYYRFSMAEFDKLLINIPIINLRRLAQNIRRLYLTDVQPCTDQLVALRFVHAIDKLYDYQSQLRIQSDITLEDIFLAEYRDWAFAKKYRRCTSRLNELCSESHESPGNSQ